MSNISAPKTSDASEQEIPFYERGLYYRTLRSRTIRGYHEDGSLFEYVVPKGHYFVCESFEVRSFTVPSEPGLAGGFVTLLTKLPDDDRYLRHIFWDTATPNRCYQRIDNPMEVIAIAAETGLSL